MLKHTHYEVLIAIAEKRTVETKLQSKQSDLDWYVPDLAVENPMTAPDQFWRVQPSMIIIGKAKLVAPMRTAPANGEMYYYLGHIDSATITSSGLQPNVVLREVWGNDPEAEGRRLKLGICWRKSVDAKNAIYAIIKLLGGVL